MSGITVLSSNPVVEEIFVALYGKAMPVRRAWSPQWRDPVEVALDTCAADPELVVVGSDIGPDHARLIIPEIDARFPAATILCLVAQPHLEYALQLLRLGVREVLTEERDVDMLRAKVDPVIHIARVRHRRTSGVVEANGRRRVVAVVSPKGGSGKTTVATNLAVGLAHQRPKKVLLLDLDVQFGDCAAALGMRPDYSLVEAVRAVNHERSTLKVFLSNHGSSLSVLSPPDDLVAADEIDVDQIKAAIAAFAEEFPFVVIDTSAGIDPLTLVAMQQATDLVLVTTPDVPAVRATKRQLEALDRIGYLSQRRIPLVNRANAKVGLSMHEIELALGLEASFQIPSSRLVPLSTNEGVAVIERDRGGNLARRFEQLVRYFAPDSDDTRGRRRGRRRAA
jgi:pilus assembly protein CpaE